jgi:polysaccharide export outer membrane protein
MTGTLRTFRVLALTPISAAVAVAACGLAMQDQPGQPAVVGTQRIAASSAAPNVPADSPRFQQRDSRYKVRNGDVIDLTFPVTPEFNQTVTVQPDGYITLTGIGDLQVSGQTIPELRQTLQQAYAKNLHDPIINIVLKDFQKPYFIASGELGHPGKYDLREDTTLTEAIAIAGGFTESSKHSQVLLFRRVSNNWVEVKRVDVKKMFAAANLTEDLHLQPGDLIFVPQNRFSKFKRFIPSPGVGMTVGPGY